MSLAALIELSRFGAIPDHELPPEELAARIERRNASYERMKQYDKEIEQRIKDREVTQELLRKTCNL